MTKSRGSSVMWLTRRHPIARVMFAGVVLLFALARRRNFGARCGRKACRRCRRPRRR